MEKNEETEESKKRSCLSEFYISIFGEGNNIKQVIFLIINLLLGTINRILQIIFYCTKKYTNDDNRGFGIDTLQQASLTFCILPTAVDAFMIGLYCLLHSEEYLTVKIKIKKFFVFLLSMEFLFPLGVHLSLRTKYSENSDNILITMRLVNALHFLFVALPQVLIVPINSSINDNNFDGIDIASLVFSIFFLIWSVGYYFICIMYEETYEGMMTNFSDKYKSNKIE
jgi:hypothetical protein